MDPFQTLLQDRYLKDIVNDSITQIFDSFDERLKEIDEEKLEIPKVTELAMLKLEALIHLATIEHDGYTNAEDHFETFEADGEPYPNKIDSWARGMVTTRKVVNEEKSFRRAVPATSGTPSVSSFRSSATGRSRNTTGNKSHRSVHSRQSERDDKTGQIMELEDDLDAEFGDFGATGYMFNMLEKAKTKRNKGFHAIDEGMKGEFEVMEEQLVKAAKEARGKKFVLDRYGQTVILGKVDPSHLPPFTTAPQASIKEEGVARGKYARDHGHGGDEAKKKRFVRVAGSRGVDEASFQPNLSLASTLTGMEAIPKLNPGVSIKSKVGERSGDPIPEDARRISKKTYLAKTTPIQPTISQLDDSEAYGGEGYRRNNSNNSKGTTKKTKTIRFDGSVKSLDVLPDIDPLEGSRKVLRESNAIDLSDDDLGLGPINSKGLSAAMVLPKKPTDRQRLGVEFLVQSPDGAKPKDRDLVKNMKPVADRKHLAAPPLGQVAGHGLMAGESPHNSVLMSGSLDSGSYSSEWFQRRKN